ncbi:MAG: cysteine--tRNA ligase [Candidatus Aminicenantales bacterium]
MGGMIRFHNTLGGQVQDFVPIEPGLVKVYTCGPTVYDFPHIGNWRAYIFEDLLKRFFVFRGFKVVHVMNITDVDDKTINGARAKGVGLDEYTRPFIEAFGRDRDTLNILPADHYPRATQHIPEMVALVKKLLEKGFAYRKDGSIYFAIDRFPAYGRLSRINLEDRRPGASGDADEYDKESVHDFALWKAPKEGEPFWETEIGPGRPGWHIECSAMSAKYLGKTFDIHCGGVDNIFPHHENEIAQSEAANGVRLANYWLHCHHLVVDGEKMSKSKGNFYRLGDILAKGYDPLDIRYLLISAHYRKMLNFTFEGLDQARTTRQRIGNFLGELKDVSGSAGEGAPIDPFIEAARSGFVASLDDDLNIAEALAAVFTLIKDINPLLAQGEVSKEGAEKLASFFAEIDTVLAIDPSPAITASGKIEGISQVRGTPGVIRAESSDPEKRLEAQVLAKIADRQEARAAKDFARADEIRQELLEAGIMLEDTKDGVRWKKVGPPKA